MANPWETEPPQTSPVPPPNATPAEGPMPWETEAPVAVQPDHKALDTFIKSAPGLREAKTPLEALQAGLQMSASGLVTGKPNMALPQNASFTQKLLYGLGQGGGDLPFNIAGVFAGGAAGAGATAETGPGIVVGTAVGAGAGSMVLPEAVRQVMLDQYEKKQNRTWSEFLSDLGHRSWEVTKAGIVGGVLGPLAGKAGGVAKGVALKTTDSVALGQFAQTSASLTTYGAGATALHGALSGQVPDVDDFTIGMINAVGFHVAGQYVGGVFKPSKTGERVTKNMQEIYRSTGIPPWQQADMARRDPKFRQEILAQDVSGEPVATKFNASRPEPAAPWKTNAMRINDEHAQEVSDITSSAYRGVAVNRLLHKIDTFGERSDAAAAAWNRAHPNEAPRTADTIVSPAGAIGRFQIMPGTARQYGFDPARLTDPVYNRQCATAIMSDLHKRFNGDEQAILVAYNAGPRRAVDFLNSGRDWSRLPLETRGYLERNGYSDPGPVEAPDVAEEGINAFMAKPGKGGSMRAYFRRPDNQVLADYFKDLGKDIGVDFEAWQFKEPGPNRRTVEPSYAHSPNVGAEPGLGIIRHNYMPGDAQGYLDYARSQYGMSPNEVIFHELGHAIDHKVLGKGGELYSMTQFEPSDAMLAEMRAASQEFAPKLWKENAAYRMGDRELMADSIAAWLSNPSRRAKMPLFTEQFGDTLQPYADRVSKTLPTQSGGGEWSPPPPDAEGKSKWADFEANIARRAAGGGGAGGTGGAGGGKPPGGGPRMIEPPEDTGGFDRMTTESRVSRFMDAIGEPMEKKSIWSLSRLTRQWITELETARQIDNEMVRRGLLNPDEQLTTEDMFRNTYASDGRASHFFYKGAIDPITFADKGGPSLQDVITAIHDVKGNIDEFNLYRVALRTIEKAKQGIDTGVFKGGVAEAMASAKDPALQKYAKINDLMQQWKRGGLEYGRDSGLFSQAQMDAMERANTSHVSLRRIMGDNNSFKQGIFGRTFRVRNPLKQMEGSDRQIIQPLTADMDNLRQIIAMADRNRAIGHLVGSAEAQGVLGLKQLPAPEVKATLAEPGSNVFKPYGLDASEAKAFEPFVAKAKTSGLKGNQFTFYRDGKPEIWEAQSEEVAQLLRGADSPAEANLIMKLAEAPARLMRTGTIFMPDFAVRVGVANELAAYIMDPNHPTPFLTFTKGALEPWKKGDAFWEWVRHGGGGVALRDLDRTYVTRDFQKLLDVSGADNGMWNTVKHPIELAQIVNERFDTAPRIGMYKSLVEKGVAPTKAAMLSRKAYLDYAERGTSEFANTLSRIIPFFRASLLGGRQLVRAFETDPVGSLVRAGAASVLPTVMFWALNRQADKDLPESERYDAISRDLKDMYFITPPIGGVRFKIRRPFQIGFTGALTERFLDAEVARDPHAMDEWAQTILKDNLPPMVPTVVAPIVEGLSNHNFYSGRPLIPDSLKDATADMQYTDYTSELAKKVSAMLGDHQGVGVAEVSPIVIDNYIREWSGSLGSQVLHAFDAPLGKEPTRPDFDVATLPFVSGFVLRHPSMSSQVLTDFYSDADKFEALHKDKVIEVRQGNFEAALADHSASGPQVIMIANVKKALGVQRQALGYIMRNDALSTDDKRQLSERIYNDAILIAKFASRILHGEQPSPEETQQISEQVQANVEATGIMQQEVPQQ